MSLSIAPSPFGSLVVSVAETGSTLSVTTVATSPCVLSMALGVPGPTGATGATGATGPAGSNGVGVAVGGTTGQALVKLSSTNYDTGWATISSGGGTWGSITGTLSNQTDLQSALDGKLSLTGGTVTGYVQFNNEVGIVGNLSIEADTEIRGNLLLTDNGLEFGSTGQGITFADASIQTTAFPPTGGTTAQYIDGTGALQTFPTVTSVGKILTSVRNNSGATMTKGTVVYINGAVGNKPTIAKAQANAEATSKATYGFVEANIANNADGNIVILGLLENIDTQGFSDGDLLYLSPTTAGGWTATQPFSPYHYVRVGTVIRGGHPTLGSIAVQVTNGFQLDEMSDVGASSPTNNNVLTWVSSSSQWLDRSISTILGYTPANGTDYLAKADNLSGLASTSTARTNLGLGTMATATASDYLAKADNLSGLASTTTARTNLGLTSLATASFATTSEAQSGTSTTTVISPSTLLDAKYFGGGYSNSITTWATATSGTGASASAQNSNGRLIAGPTTAVGYAVAAAPIVNPSRGLGFAGGYDFSKRVIFGARIARNVVTPDTNSVWRLSIGKSNTTATIGDLTVRGLMLKVAGSGALQLLVHNGTSLDTKTSTFTPSNTSAYDALIVSDGAGNVTLFVNGSSVATSTAGPTASGASSSNGLHFEVENTSTLTNSPQSIAVSNVFVQVNV